MIKLKAPVPNPDGDLLTQCQAQLEHFVDASGDEQLQSILQDLVAAYGDYVTHGGDPTRLERGRFPRREESTSPEEIGDLLYNCYASGYSNDKNILVSVNARFVGYCPYCSLKMVAKPRNRMPDRDHVLPRAIYPEFAILSINIVVACDACNDGKGSRFVDAEGNWLWIHPYFDTFLEQRLIFATVSDASDVAQVAFRVDATGLAHENRKRLERHVRELNILERMQEYVEDSIAVLLGTLQGLAPGDPLQSLSEALYVAGTERIARRPNDPMGVALMALADAEVVLERVLVGASPSASPTTS